MGVGGSDLPAILGISPHADATEEAVFAEKTVGRERKRNWAMDRGIRLEPAARAAYRARHSIPVEPVCVEHPELPWVRSSLDGYWPPLVLEIKCLRWEDHDAFLQQVVPRHVRAQVQWQLLAACSGLAHVASYNPGKRFAGGQELALVPVGADRGEQDRLLEVAERFWKKVLRWRADRAAVAG